MFLDLWRATDFEPPPALAVLRWVSSSRRRVDWWARESSYIFLSDIPAIVGLIGGPTELGGREEKGRMHAWREYSGPALDRGTAVLRKFVNIFGLFRVVHRLCGAVKELRIVLARGGRG